MTTERIDHAANSREAMAPAVQGAGTSRGRQATMSRATAHARRTDPATSAEAAASVRNLTQTQERILALLRSKGDLTRDTLADAWRETYPGDKTTDQSIRSRLAELMDTEQVIVVGEALNQRGRRVQVVGLPGVTQLF